MRRAAQHQLAQLTLVQRNRTAAAQALLTLTTRNRTAAAPALLTLTTQMAAAPPMELRLLLIATRRLTLAQLGLASPRQALALRLMALPDETTVPRLARRWRRRRNRRPRLALQGQQMPALQLPPAQRILQAQASLLAVERRLRAPKLALPSWPETVQRQRQQGQTGRMVDTLAPQGQL